MRPNILTSPLARCVSEVMDAIAKHGRVSVCVDRDGDLIVGAANSEAMSVHIVRYPKDHVGDYDRRAHSFDVLGDLAARAGEMATYGLERLRKAA